MARRSTVSRMPRELQDLFHRLVRDGHTIHAITDKLNELGAEVSKSSIGRSVKSVREMMKRYQAAQEVAGQLVAQIGENPTGDVGALLAEMLKTIAFQLMAELGDAAEDDSDEGKELRAKPMDVMLLGKALDHIERAGAVGLKRRLEIERLALQRQAKAAESVARERGLSDDQWAAIRARFLGIPEPAQA